MVCGILVLQPGIEPGHPALRVQKLNHWTAREVPELCILKWRFYVKWTFITIRKNNKTPCCGREQECGVWVWKLSRLGSIYVTQMEET